MNKYKISTVILASIIIISILAFSIIYKVQTERIEIYNLGINNTIRNIAIEQTQSGNFFIIYNNSIQQIPINKLCGQEIKA